jgi:hypothetical protein
VLTKTSNTAVEKNRQQAALVGSLRSFVALAAPHLQRSPALRARDNGAADYNPLLAWREAPHNQRINRTAPAQNFILFGLAGYPPPR